MHEANARSRQIGPTPLPTDSFLNPPAHDIGLRRVLDRFPFVPDDPERLALDCYEAYNIQVSGLEQRLSYIAGGGHSPCLLYTSPSPRDS